MNACDIKTKGMSEADYYTYVVTSRLSSKCFISQEINHTVTLLSFDLPTLFTNNRVLEMAKFILLTAPLIQLNFCSV